MTGVYDAHTLKAEERDDLDAFFAEASTKPPPRAVTPIIILFPIAGCAILLGITSVVWRNRLKGVRKRLVESARVREEARG